MRPRIFIVDVFAEEVYSGNQLAVVISHEHLSDESMQKIAAEMNYSETTFVEPRLESESGYRVRIFTPAREIAFAGHPILGTAWVIRQHLAAETIGQISLILSIGKIPVTFESSAEGVEIAWFRAPPVTPGATCDRQAMARALGISAEDIESGTPIQQMTAGTSAMIVPLRNRDALRRSRLDLEAFSPLVRQGFPPLVYLFSHETYHPQNDFSVRFFFEAHGVREDPATGNGAAFLGAYLLQHKLIDETASSLRIEQGYDLRRPSLIMLRASQREGVPQVSVGGQVVMTVAGELV